MLKVGIYLQSSALQIYISKSLPKVSIQCFLPLNQEDLCLPELVLCRLHNFDFCKTSLYPCFGSLSFDVIFVCLTFLVMSQHNYISQFLGSCSLLFPQLLELWLGFHTCTLFLQLVFFFFCFVGLGFSGAFWCFFLFVDWFVLGAFFVNDV